MSYRCRRDYIKGEVMRRILYENSLSLVMFGLFLLTVVGQIGTGWHEYNEDQKEHHQAPVALTKYLGSGHFVEALFENWESEFLQMGLYVLLTVHLRQKGSSESKKLDEPESVDADPRASQNPQAPGPVHKGGWILVLYQNSLCIVLFLLFLISFGLHAMGGAVEYNQEQFEHGQSTVTVLEYLKTSRFWFESFQNWQSEFLSIGALVVLSIFLRQKGSPESKPVDASNDETGKG
jgi:hypothetical protein